MRSRPPSSRVLSDKGVKTGNHFVTARFSNRNNAPGCGNRNHHGLILNCKCLDQTPQIMVVTPVIAWTPSGARWHRLEEARCAKPYFSPCRRICSVELMTGAPLVMTPSPASVRPVNAPLPSTMAGSEPKPLFCQLESAEGPGTEYTFEAWLRRTPRAK